jgi:hypothetical protein
MKVTNKIIIPEKFKIVISKVFFPFCSTSVDILILQHLLNYEHTSAVDFLLELEIFGKSSTYRSLSSLIKTGAVIKYSKLYELNLLGLSKLLETLMVDIIVEDTSLHDYLVDMGKIYELNTGSFSLSKVKFDRVVGVIMILSEGIPKGIKKTEEFIKVKRYRFKAYKCPIQKGNLRDKIIFWAEEMGITYQEPWSIKETGIAGNWIKQCEKNKIDPEKIIKRLLSMWEVLVDSTYNEYSKPLRLPTSPSFLFFLKHKQYILPRLQEPSVGNEVYVTQTMVTKL